MNEMIIGAAKSIIDYLEIPNYLYIKSKARFEGEKVYDSEEKYWRDLLGPIYFRSNLKNPKIFPDDIVTLKGFQLSRWYPRIPGLYWTRDGRMLRNIAERNLKYSPVLGSHFVPYDKSRMMRGGFGTLRTAEKNGLNLYGATTSGNLNAAIPVLISKKVSKNILRFTKKYPLIEIDLQGVIKSVPFTYETIPWVAHIPRLCLYVNSILNIKKYVSDFSLSASAWTIYYSPKDKDEKRYGYTYASFNPIDETSIITATDWINNYIDEYTKGKGIPITDYDEMTPRFNSAILPIEDVIKGNIDYKLLNSFFRGIDFRNQNVLKDDIY